MFLLLAVEHSFSVFDFQNNLLNWLILIAMIGFVMSRALPAVLQSRKETIESALGDAASAKAEALASLQGQQEKMANAEKEADKILLEARQIAEKMRQDMEAQTLKEAADLRTRIEHEIANERQLAVMQLRSVAARAAIGLTESSLPGAITDNIKAKLMSQFLKQVEESQTR